MIVLAVLATAGCDASPTQGGGSAKAEGAARRFEPGLWELATSVNGMTMPASRLCIDARQADAINGSDKEVAAGLAEGLEKGCTVGSVAIAGPRVTFDTICSGQRSTSSIVYSGDHYSGTMTMAGAGKMQIEGRRTGDCPSN